MFEELPFILGFMLFSVIISYIILNYTPEQLLVIVHVISILGVIIHELCHLFMCIITNTHVEKVTLVKRMKDNKYEGKHVFGGEVKISENNISFLQALLISLAPLFISFWLFFFLWEQVSNPSINAWLFFFYLFVMISIVLSSAPSFADLAMIPKAFQNDINYSFYQIFLLILSIFLTWTVVVVHDIHMIHEIFYYITIMGVYYGLKYGFRGIGNIFNLIYEKRRNFRRPRKFKSKKFTRPRFKPSKR